MEMNISSIREQTSKLSFEKGFRPASSLPWIKEVELRPTLEIAKRLHAIKALVMWVLVPAEKLPDETIIQFINDNELGPYIAPDEQHYLDTPRGNEDAVNSIGWKFENALPLAWYFGHGELLSSGAMMDGDKARELFFVFSARMSERIEDWIADKSVKTEQEVLFQEDLFYCLHNAVRSAQLGKDTVPAGFDPMGNGGVIHENRHALTWMLSSGVSWENTDLST